MDSALMVTCVVVSISGTDSLLTLIPITDMEERNWNVILHFGRGHSQVITGITKKEAQLHIMTTVFNNEDSINAQVFVTTP